MSILITGGSGHLGSELKKIIENFIAPSHKELDISNKENVLKFFQKNKIDMIIHTAALTSVRECEENKQSAFKINVVGTRNLILAAKETENSIKFVYVSTACVFDGHSEMYKESSVPDPENYYAMTKLLGEQEVSTLDKFLIIRTNFITRKKWPYPKAFTDRFGTYLFADDVAKGIKEVMQKNMQGIVHIVGDKKMSMFELAKLTTPDIQPITIKEYSGPKLTIDMSLDTERWKKYSLS